VIKGLDGMPIGDKTLVVQRAAIASKSAVC
jgi:hypothetical protein